MESSLRDVEAHCAVHMEQLNGVLLHLESEMVKRGERKHPLNL